MKLGENVARIILNPETKQITNITIYQRNLRFKCKRCAIFCCRLGGPKLTRKDIEQIKRVGYHAKDFLEPVLNSEFKGMPVMGSSLKNKEDGSCIFLKFDAEQNRYECSIYDFRPILCRLYPFDLDWIGPNSIVLKFIPCCRGLNNSDGKLVDARFIADHLLAPLLEAIELF